MTKTEAIQAVIELCHESGVTCSPEEAKKLVEIGMTVRAKTQPMSEIFEEEERKASAIIEWTAEQRKVADVALEQHRRNL